MQLMDYFPGSLQQHAVFCVHPAFLAEEIEFPHVSIHTETNLYFLTAKLTVLPEYCNAIFKKVLIWKKV